MNKKVKLKDPLVSWLSILLYFNYHNSGSFYPGEKDKIQESKLRSLLFNRKIISEIKQKAFVLLIERRTFLRDTWYTKYEI